MRVEAKVWAEIPIATPAQYREASRWIGEHAQAAVDELMADFAAFCRERRAKRRRKGLKLVAGTDVAPATTKTKRAKR